MPSKKYIPSKKYKLPKSEWVKGKSKFLFIRLNEDTLVQVKPDSAVIFTRWQRILINIKKIMSSLVLIFTRRS